MTKLCRYTEPVARRGVYHKWASHGTNKVVEERISGERIEVLNYEVFDIRGNSYIIIIMPVCYELGPVFN